MFFDAHFHYAVCVQRNVFDICRESENKYDLKLDSWKGLSCAHSPDEWIIQENSPDSVFSSFGIHPQIVGNIDVDFYKDFLLGLIKDNKLNGIGEAGFDFFTEDFKATRDIQEDVWKFQLELAIKYSLPLIVHCRKGNELLFRDAYKLKKVPVVLFHSFMGSFVEASSLIKRGINCFFSFGKQVMNNNKKVIDCVKNLPIKNLLMETDGPFQTLKGEDNTFPSDIVKVYNAVYKLRCDNDNTDLSYEEFCLKLEENSHRFIK